MNTDARHRKYRFFKNEWSVFFGLSDSGHGLHLRRVKNRTTVHFNEDLVDFKRVAAFGKLDFQSLEGIEVLYPREEKHVFKIGEFLVYACCQLVNKTPYV